MGLLADDGDVVGGGGAEPQGQAVIRPKLDLQSDDEEGIVQRDRRR